MDFQLPMVSPRAPAPCDICGKVFSNKANMNRHRISHSDVKTFECRICNRQFHRKDQLQEHWMTHAKPGSDFDCPVFGCAEQFKCFNHLKTHTEQDHAITADNPSICKHCFTLFKTARRLMIHYHTRDLVLEEENLNKLDESATNSMDLSTTNEGMALFQHLFSSSNTAPATSRKRKAQPLKVKQEAQDTSFTNILLNLISQNSNLNFAKEDTATDNSVYDDVSAYSNTSTSESVINEMLAEVSKPEESIHFVTKIEKIPKNQTTESSECKQSENAAMTIPPVTENIEENEYDCKICNITYKDQNMFLMHMGFHTSNEPLRCNMCGEISATTIEFNCHLMYKEHRQ